MNKSDDGRCFDTTVTDETRVVESVKETLQLGVSLPAEEV